MADNIHQLRPKSGDSEKITVNVGYVDLGQIDLMVQEGFYSNRTDFIRTAIRNQLERHADVVKQSTVRKRLELGLRHYSREDLEAVRAASFFAAPEAVEVVLISADLPTDPYLEFTRNETMKALDPIVRKAIAEGREIKFTTAAGARFFLKNVGTEELLKLKRSEGVCIELLFRKGILTPTELALKMKEVEARWDDPASR